VENDMKDATWWQAILVMFGIILSMCLPMAAIAIFIRKSSIKDTVNKAMDEWLMKGGK
jgi:hypothetical protein